jgi:hypothetical protein
MIVKQTNSGWFVMAGNQQIAGPFATHAQAWRWIDRREGEPVSRSEQVSQNLFQD